MAKTKEDIDPARAAERLAEAQEGLKLAGGAYQSCTKAWTGIQGPSLAKQAMWRAVVAARESLKAATATEEKHFGVMAVLVGQGELFNNDGDGETPAGAGDGPDGGPGDPPKDPPPGSALARTPPKRRGMHGGAGVH